MADEHLTVAGLRKALEGLDDDARIVLYHDLLGYYSQGINIEREYAIADIQKLVEYDLHSGAIDLTGDQPKIEDWYIDCHRSIGGLEIVKVVTIG